MLHNLVLMPIASLMLVSASPSKVCSGFDPDFDVYPMFPHVIEDHSLRSVDLGTSDAWGMLAIEHMSSENKFTTQGEFRNYKKGSTECEILTKGTVVYRLENTLRISNPYPVGSCEYKQVEAHAARHVQIARDFQAQTTPLVRKYLLKAMKGRAGAETNSIGRQAGARAEVQKSIARQLAGYAKYLDSELNKLQAQMVDSPEEMKKMFDACPGWERPEVDQ